MSPYSKNEKAPWSVLIVHEAHAIVFLKPFGKVAPQRCPYALKDGAKIEISLFCAKFF